ncbi:FAD-dependent oxidoreductase [Agromyces sp. SYSU T00194]|uniref:oxidoreductase n=1 Tax=Agromyces chitinivorans TaxID=3158560 RepID=UPI003396BCC3
MGADVDVLFTPLTLGARTARNRLTRAATTTNLSSANAVTDRLVAHYVRLAIGGVGAIVTEALRVHPSTLHGPFGIAAYDPASIPGLTQWADGVHAEGALLIGQVNHSGRQHTASSVPPRLVGPSAIACPRSGGVPHPLRRDEVHALADGYARSGLNLARAGFDGVELNGAQGHLLQQFLSPFSNRRDDEFGGSPERRAELARRILDAIRSGAPDDFVVGYRLGVDEFSDGGLTTELTTSFARMLVDEGLVDYVSFSQGNFNSIDAHLPDRHFPHTPFADVQAAVGRELADTTRIACTGVVDPSDAVAILDAGWADGIALGRALTVDPDWPRKAEQGGVGALGAIRPCIQCNYCWSGLHEGLSTLACVQNAAVGRELELTRVPMPEVRRRVVVVGAGPAGLEFARVAAGRGHDVVVLEAADAPGGKARPGVGDIGGHDGYARAAEWLDADVRRLGVDLRTGTPADVDLVLGLAPDRVVIATGATPELPAVRTDDSVALHADVASVPESLAGERVLVFDEDGHYWAAQAAEELARRGAQVVLATRFFEPFRELPIVSRIASLRRLDEHEAEIVPVHELVEFAGGDAVLRHYDSGRIRRIEGVSRALWIGPQSPNDAMVEQLRSAGVDVDVIGDAQAPRRIRNAIREGFDLAHRL